MTILIYAVYIIVPVILIGFFCIWAWFWYTQIRDSLSPKRIVFLTSPQNVIEPHIKKALDTFDQHISEVIEFGAGSGTVSRLLAKHTDKPVISYEINTLLNITHRVINTLKGITKIAVKRADIFDLKPKNAFIYCFLSTTMLTLLHKKGVFDGNIVMILKFTIEGVEPTETIPLNSSHSKLEIYDFR